MEDRTSISFDAFRPALSPEPCNGCLSVCVPSLVLGLFFSSGQLHFSLGIVVLVGCSIYTHKKRIHFSSQLSDFIYSPLLVCTHQSFLVPKIPNGQCNCLDSDLPFGLKHPLCCLETAVSQCSPSVFLATGVKRLSVSELNELLEEIEAAIKQYSEELVQQLALRDELEFEKEVENSFISALIEVQNKQKEHKETAKKKKKLKSGSSQNGRSERSHMPGTVSDVCSKHLMPSTGRSSSTAGQRGVWQVEPVQSVEPLARAPRGQCLQAKRTGQWALLTTSQ